MDNKKIAKLLRELADCFDSNGSKTDSGVIGGIVSGVVVKEGKKGEFLNCRVGKMFCKCFDSGLFESLVEGTEVAVQGHTSEFNGFTSFIIESVAVKPSEKSDSNDSDDDSDAPF